MRRGRVVKRSFVRFVTGRAHARVDLSNSNVIPANRLFELTDKRVSSLCFLSLAPRYRRLTVALSKFEVRTPNHTLASPHVVNFELWRTRPLQSLQCTKLKVPNLPNVSTLPGPSPITAGANTPSTCFNG